VKGFEWDSEKTKNKNKKRVTTESTERGRRLFTLNATED
jgi:hypothetical protein